MGTLRLWGRFAKHGTAEADGRDWEIGPRRGPRRGLEAVATAEGPGGTFRRGVRDGSLMWDGRDYAVRRTSWWRSRYALCDGHRELLRLEFSGFSRRPVSVTAGDPAALDAGLALFAAFAARKLGSDRRTAGNVADLFAGGGT